MDSGSAADPRPRTMKKSALETPSIQSLDRGLFILEAVAKSEDPVPLGQLTSLLGIDRSSVFRLANTLRRRGFLANPNGRKDYILGPSIWRLSRKYDWSRTLTTFCHEHLKLLANETGETSHVAVREGRRAFFIDHQASPNQIIVISGQTGEFVPLYCTAHGKALLADCELPELKAIFGTQPLESYTARTIVSLPQLAKACARIRADGYAIDEAEYVEGVRCMAAPIRDKDETVIASIGISAPIARLPRERYSTCAKQVVRIAQEISGTLSSEAVR
jgi:IclR family acetate operon transcriptional repressor